MNTPALLVLMCGTMVVFHMFTVNKLNKQGLGKPKNGIQQEQMHCKQVTKLHGEGREGNPSYLLNTVFRP